MKYRSRGLVLAIENDDTDADETCTTQEDELEVPADVVEEIGDSKEDSDEINDLTSAIEEAIDDSGTIENITDVMADSVEKGEGLDSTAAEIAEVAVESICQRLGIRNAKIMPAIESFGSANSRLTATRVSMEGLGETLTRVWSAIKSATSATGDKINSFLGRVIAANEKLGKAAAEFKANVAHLEGDPQAEEVEARPALAVGDKNDFASLSQLFSNHEKLTTAGLASLEALRGILGKGFGEFNPADVEAESAKILALFEKLPADTAGNKVSKNGKTVTRQSGQLVNGKIFLVEVVEDKPGFTISFETVGGGGESKTTKTLSLAEIGKVADSVEALVTATAAFKAKAGMIKEIGKEIEKISESALKIAKKIGGDEHAAAKNAMAAARILVKSSVVGFTKVSSELPWLNIQLGKEALKFASASAKQYSKKAAE